MIVENNDLIKQILNKFNESIKNVNGWTFYGTKDSVANDKFIITYIRPNIYIQVRETSATVFDCKVGLFRNRKYYNFWKKIKDKVVNERNTKRDLEYKKQQNELLLYSLEKLL